MREVNLSGSRISEPSLLLSPSLRCLIVRNCDLKALPSNFGIELQSLLYLDISENQIEDLQALKGMRKLRVSFLSIFVMFVTPPPTMLS